MFTDNVGRVSGARVVPKSSGIFEVLVHAMTVKRISEKKISYLVTHSYDAFSYYCFEQFCSDFENSR